MSCWIRSNGDCFVIFYIAGIITSMVAEAIVAYFERRKKQNGKGKE